MEISIYLLSILILIKISYCSLQGIILLRCDLSARTLNVAKVRTSISQVILRIRMQTLSKDKLNCYHIHIRHLQMNLFYKNVISVTLFVLHDITVDFSSSVLPVQLLIHIPKADNQA